MRVRRLFWIAAALALAAGLAVFAGLRSYRAFTHEELVATVECRPAPAGAGYAFLLGIRQVERGVPGPEEAFPMQGEQWMLGGDILKWAPWLTSLGAKPVHKLTRLDSRRWKAGEETALPRTAYDLNGGSSALWRWLHRFGPSLPLVDAVYGNAAYTDARPGGRWGVYATHSGYLIRPLEKQSAPR